MCRYRARGRRGFLDWLSDTAKSLIPCLTSGAIPLIEKSWEFFSFTKIIPIYGPLVLELIVSAGAYVLQ